jgi:uncharacterized protein YbjT (DUF2867 family)
MKVLLTGATGFVGSEILKQLIAAGHQIRVIARDPKNHLPINNPQIEVFNGNIIHAPSISGCMDGIEAVLHIVGIIVESEENTYDRVHRVGTQNVVNEAKKAKVKRFIHMSSLGTRENARSQYHQTKWAAEEIVRASGLDWTIFRPSVIYGPNDSFVNFFAKMMQFPRNVLNLFTVPLIDGGNNKLQPIPVTDVAKCFVGALEKPESVKKVYDLCGPEPLAMKDVLKAIATAIDKDSIETCPIGVLKGLFIQPKVLLTYIPMPMARVMARIMETFFSKPPLNRDQLIMIQEDNVGDPSPAIKDFGIDPPKFETGLARIFGQHS